MLCINKIIAVFFYILKKPETNVLESLSNEEFIEVRKGIIQCILATDMAKHSTLVNQFKSMTENFDFKNPEHRSMVNNFKINRIILFLLIYNVKIIYIYEMKCLLLIYIMIFYYFIDLNNYK